MANFNFYQYNGLGNITFFTGSVIHPELYGNLGVCWTGPILPISDLSFTEYTGYYLPKNIFLGATKGFRLQLGVENDTYAPLFRTIYSGKMGEAGNDSSDLGINIFGVISPLVSEIGSLGNFYSGEVASGLNDYPNFGTVYSGFYSGDSKDSSDFGSLISGSLDSSPKDYSNYSSKVSGFCKSGIIDSQSFGCKISGQLLKKDKDYFSTTFSLVGISYIIKGLATRITSGDNANITFNLSTIIYNKT
jgi:hypothetical protein